ncbi:MAG TPA: hypothetical protein PLG10_02190 [Candidatus Dojkabacteria bacterium]|jgi:hypothetical protein|nr:hypothetical protein [Candidatus Dojkabacteria bacterium]
MEKVSEKDMYSNLPILRQKHVCNTNILATRIKTKEKIITTGTRYF